MRLSTGKAATEEQKQNRARRTLRRDNGCHRRIDPMRIASFFVGPPSPMYECVCWNFQGERKAVEHFGIHRLNEPNLDGLCRLAALRTPRLALLGALPWGLR